MARATREYIAWLEAGGWRSDLEAAPRGHWVDVKKMVAGREVWRKVHIPALVIAAGNGGVVTITRWLPHEGRWLFFTAGTPPLAWRPFPAHPDVGEGHDATVH